ncbi:hypothetical protein MXB_3291, partial [Myxobolus squamalis]
MSSVVLSDVLGKFDSESGAGRVNILLATAIALFPLLIDNVFDDSVYTCPTQNRKFYSLFLMLAPSACAIVLGLIMSAEYFKNHNELGSKEILECKTAHDMLAETLNTLAQTHVKKELSIIIKEIKELTEFDEERLSELIKSYHRIEK